MNEKEVLARCYNFLIAVHEEVVQFQEVEEDKRAYALAQMKINLVGYLRHVWPKFSDFKTDLDIINSLINE